MAPTLMSDQQPERKKRRQNVACDSCRLRRVKCDMLAILTPQDTSRPAPPLHVLVRENPDVSCSNCISKGIRCTTNQIVNPAKPNKGGKRIEEAKKMYGSDGSALTPPSGGSEQLTPLPLSTTPAPRGGSVTHENSAGSSLQYRSASADNSSLGLDINSTQDGVFPISGDAYDSGIGGILPDTSSTMNNGLVDPGLLDPRSAPKPWTVEWGSTAFSTPWGTPFAGGMYDSTFVQEPLPWKAFLSPPTPAGADAGGPSDPSPSATPAPTIAPSLNAAYHDVFATSGYRVGSSTMPYSMSSSLPAPATALDTSDQFRTERFGSTGESLAYQFHPTDRPRPSGSPPPQVAGRKRTFSKDIDGLFSLEEIDETVPTPWASSSGPIADRSVRWTRREQVAERLADRALESELSRHLVRVYFQAVHFTLPGISPESFFLEWRRAGERSDRMEPSQEVLCAVLEAWAARFSDHPVVLGFDPKDPAVYNYSPKVILDTGQFVPASPDRPDRSDWGRKRLPACMALVNRVRKLIDFHGILRKPTTAGVQALILFTQLQHMTDVDADSIENSMESEMMHGVAIAQMRVLNMSWSNEADKFSFSDYKAPTQNGHWRFIRLFWSLVVSDSFWAAASCNEPKVSEEDMEASHLWIQGIESMDGPPSLRKMGFFLKSYYNYCIVGRRIATKLSVPSKRPGRIEPEEFCQTVRQVWGEILALHTDVNTRAKAILEDEPEQLLGASPVHTLASLRQCGTFLLLIVHQIVAEMVQFRFNILKSYGDSPSDQKDVEAERLKTIKQLHTTSTDNLLAICRAQAPLFKRLLPTGMLQSSSMMVRVLLATAEFLCRIPTNEQGYSNTTRGGIEWTWANKEREVGYCVEALYQFGWAWSDVSATLDKIREAMQTMQPDVQELVSYAAKAKPRGYPSLVVRRNRDLERDANSLEAAMLYWPPRCVPLTLDLLYDSRIAAQARPPELQLLPQNGIASSGLTTQLATPRTEQTEDVVQMTDELTTAPLYHQTLPDHLDEAGVAGDELTDDLDALLASFVNGDPTQYV